MFTIPRPEWVSDDLVAERGPHAGFQMFTREGNDAVALMLTQVFGTITESRLLPSQAKELLYQGVKSLAQVHPEVHDTEPECAIVDAANAFFDSVGFKPISRDDL